MTDEEPVVVSKVSIISNVFALFFAAMGCKIIIGPNPAPVFAFMLLGLAGVMLYSIWKYSLVIYSDRILVKYFFTRSVKTIFLKDISSWMEKKGGRGGPWLILHTRQGQLDINSDAFSNYDEMKSAIVKHVQHNHFEEERYMRRGGIIIFIATVVIVIIFILTFLFAKS